MTTHPEFPRCPIRGHKGHELRLIREAKQDGTGTPFWLLACPTDNHRFLFIPGGYANTGEMPHFTKPRWGWSKKIWGE